jgi:hypothetical protein
MRRKLHPSNQVDVEEEMISTKKIKCENLQSP